MYKKLLEQAQQKASAATTILEGETPNVEEANSLLAEAKALRERAEAIKMASDLKDEADKAIKAYDKLEAEPPTTPAGGRVIEDEADKKAKGKTWSLGEFCQAIANQDQVAIGPYKSIDQAGFYDVGKALGVKGAGSVTAIKAITGMSESVPADGGLLVGTDMNNTIMGRTYQEAQIIQRVSMLGISGESNGMSFVRNAESSRTAGNRWGGAQYYWAAEAAEKTASAPTFQRIWLELQKIIGLVYATDELLQDASALEGYILDILPRELRVGVQNAFYNGTGAGQPQGILGAPCLVTQAAEAGQAAATIVSENIINMYSRRWVGAGPYVWMVNQDIMPQIMQMNLGVGAGGALTFMPPGGLSGLPYATLLGLPMIEIEQCPTLGTVGDIALCAWSEYQAIEKGGIQSASSIHVRFIFDESVFRFVYRVMGTPKWNLPLTPMNSTVTQGPFVVLATRA